MYMTRQDIPKISADVDLLVLLNQATQDGKKIAAALCSARLDKLATYAVIEGLNAVEVIELIRSESEYLSGQSAEMQRRIAKAAADSADLLAAGNPQ